jgi:DNA invertase Pin-like site-specific DNA recombinase
MRIDTAVSLIRVVMEVVLHRQHCLKEAGGDLPMELLMAAYAELDADDASGTLEWLLRHGVEVRKSGLETAYHRRSNNQKSAETEELIRQLLQRGLSKTAIAKQLKVNRRVVIRVAREALQSAQH